MLRLADIASSVFAAAFAVALVLGVATVSDLAMASEPLTATTCTATTECTDTNCELERYCAPPPEFGYFCQCYENLGYSDPCDCYLVEG